MNHSKSPEISQNDARKLSQIPNTPNRNDKDMVHDEDDMKMTPEPAEDDDAVTIIKTDEA